MQAPHVQGWVGAVVATVDIDVGVAALDEHVVVELVAEAGFGAPREFRCAVGVVEARADVAPPRIPPTTGYWRAVGDV